MTLSLPSLPLFPHLLLKADQGPWLRVCASKTERETWAGTAVPKNLVSICMNRASGRKEVYKAGLPTLPRPTRCLGMLLGVILALRCQGKAPLLYLFALCWRDHHLLPWAGAWTGWRQVPCVCSESSRSGIRQTVSLLPGQTWG